MWGKTLGLWRFLYRKAGVIVAWECRGNKTEIFKTPILLIVLLYVIYIRITIDLS